MFARLYDARSFVRIALTTIGSALPANRMVEIIPANSANSELVMPPTVGIGGRPPRRTECATWSGRRLRGLSYNENRPHR
jgi:hypothetical protein